MSMNKSWPVSGNELFSRQFQAITSDVHLIFAGFPKFMSRSMKTPSKNRQDCGEENQKGVSYFKSEPKERGPELILSLSPKKEGQNSVPCSSRFSVFVLATPFSILVAI